MQWIFASSRGLIGIDLSSHKIEKRDRKTKCYEWDSNSHHNIYIIHSTPTPLTTEPTRHAISATLIKYVASERSAALKRKMFGVSDGGELGHFWESITLLGGRLQPEQHQKWDPTEVNVVGPVVFDTPALHSLRQRANTWSPHACFLCHSAIFNRLAL